MTGPAVETDPLEALKALRANQTPQGAPDDPLAQLKALRGQQGPPAVPGKASLHAEYQSGALAKRMEGANARDQENAAEDTEPVGYLHGAARRILPALANVAQGIPGAEAAEAGVRSVVRGQSYREALGDLRQGTGALNSTAASGERMAGAAPMAAVLPANPALAGGLLGAADQALSADPDKTLGQRAVGAVAGGVAGAVTGKALDTGLAGLRTILAKPAAANLVDRMAARAASAKEMYTRAIQQGQGKVATKAIQRVLAEPDNAEIIGELQKLREFQGVAPDSPEMLDAVYKVHSDRAAQLKRSQDAVTPNKPNVGRYRLSDTKQAQSRLLDALETPGTVTHTIPAPETAPQPKPQLREAIGNFWDRIATAHARKDGTVEQQLARRALERHDAERIVSPPLTGTPHPLSWTEQTPPVMPTYREAVSDFANQSEGIEGVKRGNDALRGAMRKSITPSRNLARGTPQSLEQWAAGAPDASRKAAAEGALGGAKEALTKHPFTTGRKALVQVPGVLRSVNDPTQALTDQLIRLGLISANAGTPR